MQYKIIQDQGGVWRVTDLYAKPFLFLVFLVYSFSLAVK